MAILRAAATASFTLDNTGTAVLITGLTLTPASDDYLLFATVETENAGTGGSESNDFSVWVGGTEIAHSIRNHQEETSYDGDRTTVVLNAKVSPTGSQAVEIRHTTSSASSPQTAFRREMNLFPMPAAGTNYEDTSTSPVSVTSATWVTLTGMSRTPVADDYLLVFTCEYEGTADDPAGFRVEVGGTAVAHTVRSAVNDGSAANTPRSLMIACEVNPTGSQVVEIAWQNKEAAGTVTCNNRAMQLIPVDAADIVEASGTANDARSATGEILIDNMTITDPGVDDWLVLFSAWDQPGTIGNLIQTTYMIYEGGAKVTDSDRRNDHEGSQDGGELPVSAGGRVTIAGATDDLQMYWDNSTTDTYTLHERTLVAMREASAGAHTADGAPSVFLPTASGAAEIINTATGAPSVFLPTAAGVAEILNTATGAPSIFLPTAAGVAEILNTATGAPSVFLPTAAGVAGLDRSATGAPSIILPTSSGAAEIINTATGAPSIILPTAAGVAEILNTATGTPSVFLPVAAGVAGLDRNATGAPSVFLPTSSGTADVAGTILANGAPSVFLPTSSGVAGLDRNATGAPSVFLPTASGTAEILNTATGAPSVFLPTAAGAAELIKTATGAPSVFLPTAAGAAEVLNTATGAPSVFLPTAAGTSEIIKTAAGAPSVFLPTAAGDAHPCSQTLAPDTIAAIVGLSGAVTDIDEPVNSPDANWLLLAA